MTYCPAVCFVESPVFTRLVDELLSDEDYAAFQHWIAAQPEAGDLIPGTGGLRKVRWAADGTGKRGGVRVIYFCVVEQAEIRLLLIYRKGVKDDLTTREKAVLKEIKSRWC